MSQKTIHGPWCCARMASAQRLAATEDVSLALVQSRSVWCVWCVSRFFVRPG